MLAEYVVLGDEDEVRRRWEKVFEVPLVDGSVTMNFIFEELMLNQSLFIFNFNILNVFTNFSYSFLVFS